MCNSRWGQHATMIAHARPGDAGQGASTSLHLPTLAIDDMHDQSAQHFTCRTSQQGNSCGNPSFVLLGHVFCEVCGCFLVLGMTTALVAGAQTMLCCMYAFLLSYALASSPQHCLNLSAQIADCIYCLL